MIKKLLLIFFLLCTPCYGGVNFDKVDDSLSATSVTDLLRNTYSISFWITPVDAGENGLGRVIDWVVDGSNASRIFLFDQPGTSQANVLQINRVVAGTSRTAESVQNFWVENTKIHVVITYDNAGNTSFYKDGVFSSTDSVFTSHPSGTTTLFFGNNATDGIRTFNGQINEFAIWNGVVLSTAEISLLFNSKIKRLPLQIQPSFLKVYYPLDGASDGESADGVTFIDMSINGYNATGSDGANNTGLTGVAETVLTYP